MAISATNGGTINNSSAGTTLTFSSFSASAGQAIVVAVAILNTSVSVSSITDTAGNTYTLRSSVNNSTSVRTELWACSPTLGNSSNVIVVTLSGSSLASAAYEEYGSSFTSILSRSSWSVISASSQTYGAATGAINGSGAWITGGGAPQWIIIDMGSAMTYSGITISPNQSNAVGTNYTLDVSDNGSSWTNGVETSPTYSTAVALQTWPLSTSYTHRYFRINNTANNGYMSTNNIYLGTLQAITIGNIGSTATGTSMYAEGDVLSQDSSNVGVTAIAVASSSGDTFGSYMGTARQYLIPALTTAGVALVDNTSLAIVTLREAITISASRAWAAVSLELRTGIAATDITASNITTPASNAGQGAFHQIVKAPPSGGTAAVYVISPHITRFITDHEG